MNNQHYRVVGTGDIGKIVPCPCDNPVILQFKNGSREAYFLRELEPTTHPITMPTDQRQRIYQDTNKKGRSRFVTARTIDRMHKILSFLEAQTEAVYRTTIEKAIGVSSIAHTLMDSSALETRVSLERLGLVERLPGDRTWLAWRITPLGREQGHQIVDNINDELKYGGDYV